MDTALTAAGAVVLAGILGAAALAFYILRGRK
jgi:hypothetical protein